MRTCGEKLNKCFFFLECHTRQFGLIYVIQYFLWFCFANFVTKTLNRFSLLSKPLSTVYRGLKSTLNTDALRFSTMFRSRIVFWNWENFQNTSHNRYHCMVIVNQILQKPRIDGFGISNFCHLFRCGEQETLIRFWYCPAKNFCFDWLFACS